jgi:hypothetical protein
MTAKCLKKIGVEPFAKMSLHTADEAHYGDTVLSDMMPCSLVGAGVSAECVASIFRLD